MRKKLCLLIAFCMMFSIFTVKSFATTTAMADKSLYIVSDSVSEDVISYAKEEKKNVFLSLEDTIPDEINQLNKGALLSYGTAFKLNEIDYIPIISDGKILALLAISETDGVYGWTLSESFSPELNNIAAFTSIDAPAKLYIKKGNIYADISENTYPLTSHPEMPTIDDPEELERMSQTNIIDVLKVNGDVESKVSDIFYESRATYKKFIKLDLKEQQGEQTWCSAFAGAQILRARKKGEIKAEHIMKYFYPQVGSEALKQKSINHAQLMEYANTKNSTPTRKEGVLSMRSVKKQINAKKPIYLGCYGSGKYQKARHALVLRGYNANSKAYSVWNPWNPKYVTMSASNKNITVEGGSFTWDVSIYNW